MDFKHEIIEQWRAEQRLAFRKTLALACVMSTVGVIWLIAIMLGWAQP